MRGLADNLRELRGVRGLTQNELGTRAGMAPAAVSHFETGQRVPSLESVVKLAEALEVSIDALLGRAGVGAQPQMDPVFLRAAQADTATLDIIKRVTETLLADADRRSPKR